MSTETTEVTDPRQGHTSASNAAADRRCHGRHNAQRGIPEPPSSEDASFGAATHNALAKDNPEGLTTEQLSIYESCVEIRDKLISKYFGDDAPNVKVTKEKRWWCKVKARAGDTSASPEFYKHSGQVDYVARLGSRALILEYKALPGDVPSSPKNEQLRDQVVLAAGNMIFSECATAVIQPLVTHDPELCHYDGAAIKQSEKEMFERVRHSNNPNAPRTPNPVSCKFCTAKLTCVEYEEWAANMVPDTNTIKATPVAQWSPEMRAHFLNLRPVAQAWLDACNDEMKRLVKEDPNSIPGWGLKGGTIQSPVTDPQELFGRLVASSTDIKQEDLLPLYMSCVEVNKGELEGLVRKVTGLKGKGLRAKLDELLAGITESKQNAPSLAKQIT